MPKLAEKTHTAHQDTFCRDHLPPPELCPEFDYSGLPELRYPERINCAVELLDKMVAQHGDRIVFHHASGKWKYKQLLETANRIAHVLTEDLGMVPGNRVLLRGANSPMMAACWFAAIKAGGVAVCTGPLLRVRELIYVADKAEIKLALTDSKVAGDCELAMKASADGKPRAAARVVHFNSDAKDSLESLMRAKPATFNNCDTAADDVAMIAFTSGSTGRGKATIHFHRDVIAAADCFPRYVLKPDQNDIFCGSPSFSFTYGLGGLLLFPVRFGASSVLLEHSSPAELLKGIVQHRATVCFTSPTAYRAMLKLIQGEDLSSLKKCVSAGEHLPVTICDAWQKATGIKIIDGIGSTEMLHIFISASGDDVRPGSTGKAVPGYRAKVVDDDGNDLPAGSVGRLAVQGPTGCRYLDDPEQQQKYVQDGWNLTGDCFRMDEQGYFWYQARTDDMIVSSGYNISGPEVEGVLLDHPHVAECAVVGVPDEDRGQLVKAFVVLTPDAKADDATAKRLQDFVKQQIAPYKYPRAVQFVSALPKTTTGKLQRFRLREQAKSSMEFIQPQAWPRPHGYANATIATGKQIFVAGQVGWDPVTSQFASDDFAQQTKQALKNVVAVLQTAGAGPEHITRMTWFITDKDAYLKQRRQIGEAYREVVGKHFPAMSVVVVSALIEDRAKIEIEATAIVPE
jgi:2-aminobenzoate-CoA ligase